jgi:capsular polysaccharide transport system permease protein
MLPNSRSRSGEGRGYSLNSLLFRVVLLSAENVGERYRRSRLAFALAILEPLGVVALFTLVHSLTVVRPPFGSSTTLFYATGILPFYLFFHVSWRMRAWDRLRRFPNTSSAELMISHLIPEFLVKFFIIFLLIVWLALAGNDDAIPMHPLTCLAALFLLVCLGLAVGFINSVIGSFFVTWLYIYPLLMRAWMALSGVLFVVDRQPVLQRELASWIPITHAVTLYRTGQYIGYPAMTLDLNFLLMCTGGALLLSFLLQTSTKEWRPIP